MTGKFLARVDSLIFPLYAESHVGKGESRRAPFPRIPPIVRENTAISTCRTLATSRSIDRSFTGTSMPLNQVDKAAYSKEKIQSMNIPPASGECDLVTDLVRGEALLVDGVRESPRNACISSLQKRNFVNNGASSSAPLKDLSSFSRIAITSPRA
ncbi:hypothetical protein H0H92_009643 [Tricholoma furcatifolium]|nr:hypothetical protein H0H92_009643 [Tricholoma furcatifolium]